MEISSRSWHLRFVRTFEKNYEPNNLCSHFWKVVGYILMLTALIPMAIVGWPLYLLFLGIKDGTRFCYNKLRPKSQRTQLRQSGPPDLLLEFSKAKKRKLCPLITVKEEVK